MSKKRVLITGGAGKAGHWILKHFIEQGYDVTSVDTRSPAAELACHHLTADLTDLGQTIDALGPHATGNRAPYDGIVHMAAIPRPQMHANQEVWRINTNTTYNVLEACGLLGIKKAVIASSESSYGFCFADELFDPVYLPIDEAHPQLPADTYGLTKVVNEATAAMFHRRDGTQILSYRIGNVVCPEDYESIKARAAEHPEDRLRIFWSYIDSRDLASACRLGIEGDNLGCEPIIIASDDSSSPLPSQELISRFLPNVTDLRADFSGRKSLISNQRAKDLLGWKQEHFF
ncbi:NAD-dependent epimerase/dehydratase family protein [Synoicihabitans lomoniglobus]|uniref:NAD(P)-dependent oxidoreductase n=1 Tax=Synoicihabitans lomoniglobus TaxID=2909285 RepID=A0AAE9ZXX4_9BACT|nr:NAD(P)-dependent oxidoreductase [Opitutaceae bacterium LMO-M01]WED65189.1 NAD(P)-dependent oxidoreductase [Opitutaceae bacterium LMO-M01]